MLNLSTTHKRIIRGLFICALFAMCLYLPVVDAAGKTYCKKSGSVDAGDTIAEIQSDIIQNRYGLKLESLGNNKFKLTMNPPENKTERCKTTLEIEKINGKNSDGKVSCDKAFEFTESSTQENEGSGLSGVTIKVVGKDIISKEGDSSSCYYKKATGTIELSVDPGVIVNNKKCPDVTIQNPNYDIGTIDCTGVADDDTSFKGRFCYAKNHAQFKKKVSADSFSTETEGDYSSLRYTGSIDAGNYYCEADLTKTANIPYNSDELTGEAYFTNHNYLYAYVNKNISMGYYEYNYAPGVCVTSKNPITCKITCEESVEVEYGPPVASFAGMCFQYKVRVTSRVSCKMRDEIKPPAADCNYHTPSPICVHYDGSTYLQGGPNEEYDACIKSCDGGKYTDKCSNKCYKQVYGKSTKAAAKINNSFLDNAASLLAKKKKKKTTEPVCSQTVSKEACMNLKVNGTTYNTTGCYYVSGGGIYWYDNGAYNQGRWYAEHPGGRYHNGQYIVAQDDGFWRHNYGTDYCHDDCSWNDSNYASHYINDGLAQNDYLKNIKKYNDAVVACRNMTKCSTETAEFTIEADYTKYGDSSATAIKFPYGYDKDTITTSSDHSVTSTKDQKNTTLLPNYPAEYQGLKGCYLGSAPESNLYRSTWGFPGAWKNLKTNEITYTNDGLSEIWEEFPNQFCIPNDASDVNKKWFYAFYNRKLRHEHVTLSDTTSKIVTTKYEEVKSYTCKDGSDCERSKRGSYDGITYNIKADTKKFGYFNWTIGMRCFYALISDDVNPNDPDHNYTVRTVDLENIFPSSTGNETSVDAAGRESGFNWSAAATNNKNPNYTSDPVAYMKALQKSAKTSGSEIYSDSNLDYRFYLSPETLRNLRKDTWGSGGSNYTAFSDSGFSVDKNGVGRYISPVIRDNSKIPSADRILPKDQALVCNNMINHASTACCTGWKADGSCK